MRASKISKLTKIALALAVTVLGPGLIAASADSINVSGTFANGDGTFTGMLTVNDASETPNTGEMITGGTLILTGLDAGTYTMSFSQNDDIYGISEYLFQDSSGATPSTPPYVDLEFIDSASISNASMCTDATASNPSCSIISQLRPSYDDTQYADVTSASTATATPEPGSLGLLALGLVGLGLAVRKQEGSLVS